MLALPLLVPGIGADVSHHPAPFHYLAFFTSGFNRCSDFHYILLYGLYLSGLFQTGFVLFWFGIDLTP
jgi:hypothetical protein